MDISVQISLKEEGMHMEKEHVAFGNLIISFTRKMYSTSLIEEMPQILQRKYIYFSNYIYYLLK